MKYLFIILLFNLSLIIKAQENNAPESAPKQNKELRYILNADSSQYIKFTFLNQVWLRQTENNPGSTIFDNKQDNTFDISIRRIRFQLFGKISDKVFVYTQFGQNNLNYKSPRKLGLFFLDAITEYQLTDKTLHLGAGLTSWGGPTRYSSPSIGSILSMDAPLYQQTTADATDQFIRKYSVYAKGKLGKLDYRIAMSTPMSIQNSGVQNQEIVENALFTSQPSNVHFQGYFMYQFLNQEKNTTPYNTGSYLGKKRIFNIGAGFVFQEDAMWRLNVSDSSTVKSDLGIFAIDVFYDAPINKQKGNAITSYVSYSFNDYGKNYIRNVGVSNPMNGSTDPTILNGGGNAFPMMGSGSSIYGQIGYLSKDSLLGKFGKLQPYFATQYSNFDRLNNPMIMMEGGINWLINGHNSKLSLNYQSRPIFVIDAMGEANYDSRKGMFVLQFQTSI